MMAEVFAEHWSHGECVERQSVGRIRIEEPRMYISARQYCKLWQRAERYYGRFYYRVGTRIFFVLDNGLVARPAPIGGAFFG